ncbi:uncharacterized protein TRIADDRAFT_27823 [Trichoplax adhaerens]|uniref:ZZ-type domain-containing protein n=1 Tax=Trichoplax adhaerens TaxID=10228 RepID=B3S1D5_TRIAD|nr:hypothetical protein TRIADDRAFT_27823 [Trichoplax adhaerens]EDV23308.1 hypothetical protein TRIADDRAFT_27823 [Trichoplax adhaerens]|eukprot:XP_002114218.1 hypothetical protein TRIADDRAFT_27823 [Trichoplax adhaerens]
MIILNSHKTCRTQWDHPTTTDILREIDQLNYIKFAAYRTAIKMRIIQQRFDKVEFLRLLSVFDQLGYGTQQSSDDDEVQDMNVLDLENILVKLFSQPTLANDIELANPLLSTDLALNFALNIFDRDRSGKLKLTAIKIFLTVMCKGYLRDKYQFLFKLIANRGKFANAEGLESLLSQLMQIVSYIKEDPSFGGIHSIQNAVKNCYDKAAHPSVIKEEEFTQWVLEEPQTIVWLSTMERVIAAENVVHDVKCGICKKTPIVGLRFKSLKKFNFDICQNCFLSGKSGKHHKAGDPTQEYCVATTSKEGVKDFARTFRNKVTKRYKRKAAKPRYICIENSSSILEETEPQNDQEESSQNQSTNPPDQSQNSTFSQNDANRDGNETEEAEERETAIIDSSFIAM